MISKTLNMHVLGGKEVLLSLFERRGDEAQRTQVTCSRSQVKLMVSWRQKINLLGWCLNQIQFDSALDSSQAPELKPPLNSYW